MSGFNVGAAPVPEIARGAVMFQRASGIQTPRMEPDYSHVVMPTATTHAISRAYDAMPDHDPRALPAYRAMREETGRQYDYLSKPRSRGGLGIDVEVTKGDPYGTDGSYHHVVNELRDDVQNNNRIKVLSTATTGGHPFFSNDENDQFRAVHDVFGHLGSGRGVDRHGEEAAFQKHAAMFSPLARAALASETRGQNSWLHAQGQGNFPEQKFGLLPPQMRRASFAAGVATVSDREQALRQNKNQGLG